MPITKKQAIETIKQFIEEKLVDEKWYQNIKSHIKAIILYGSVAKGLNRADSDIDILVIVPLAIEEKYTQGEYFYYYKNNEINIVLRSIERLRKLAEEQSDSFQAEVFRESEIIWKSDNGIEELINKIKSQK